MRHRCDEFIKLGLRCPGRHPWEEEEDCDPNDEDCDDDDDEEDDPLEPEDLLPPEIPFYLMLPERSAEPTQLIGLDALAAEAFAMEWGASVPWGDRYPKAAIVYDPFPGYFLPYTAEGGQDTIHVGYATGPAIRAGRAEPEVLVKGKYYTGSDGYAAELIAIAAAAILGIGGAYIMTQGIFQNLTSFMMGRYLTAPASTGTPGKGYFFQAETFLDQPGDVFDRYVADAVVGEQPSTWY